jgi:hypothetical protein
VGIFTMLISFEVLLKEDIIIVNSVDDSFDTLSIEIHKFWDWVKRNELNAYCIDYYDPSEVDGHGQDSGYLSMEDYLNLNPKIIENDLITYLKNKKNKPKI